LADALANSGLCLVGLDAIDPFYLSDADLAKALDAYTREWSDRE
jgi:hypothetical protein